MGVNSKVDDRGFIVITPVGKNAVEDYVGVFRNLSKDENTRNINRLLFDTRQIEVSLSNSDIADLTQLLDRRGRPEDRKVAVLVQSNLKYGLTRMYMALAEEETFQIFSCQSEAEQWLLDFAD